MSLMYAGANPLRTLYAKVLTLKRSRYFSGSQRSSRNTGVMCSLLRDLVIRSFFVEMHGSLVPGSQPTSKRCGLNFVDV